MKSVGGKDCHRNCCDQHYNSSFGITQPHKYLGYIYSRENANKKGFKILVTHGHPNIPIRNRKAEYNPIYTCQLHSIYTYSSYLEAVLAFR